MRSSTRRHVVNARIVGCYAKTLSRCDPVGRGFAVPLTLTLSLDGERGLDWCGLEIALPLALCHDGRGDGGVCTWTLGQR